MKKETPIQISYNSLLIIIINVGGQIKFITEPFAKLLGYSVDELIGQDVNRLFKRDDLSNLETLIKTIDGSPSLDFHNFDSLIVTNSDESIDLNLQIIQLSNHYLNNFSYVILSDNIIYRKFVRQVFEKSKHDLQEIYNLSNELILVLNSEKKVIYTNNKWEENFGIKATTDAAISLETLFDIEVVSEFVQALDTLSEVNSFSKIGRASCRERV